MRQAIEKHNMIEDGDKIGIGLSGGKDSVMLVYALSQYRKFSNIDFQIQAFTIDLGFEAFNTKIIEKFCKNLDVPLTIVETPIKEIVFDIKKETNPCSLCSHMRRGAINNAAKENGVNKLALGHHRDDLVDSFFLSTFYEGKFYVLPPKSYLDKKDLTIIRPFIYVEEDLIIKRHKKHNLPISKNPCIVDGKTKRQEVNDILKRIYKDIPVARANIFNSILNEYEYL